MSMLVVVPCGKSKIWDKHPDHGPVPAESAYTGAMCRLNRQYAEQFGVEGMPSSVFVDRAATSSPR